MHRVLPFLLLLSLVFPVIGEEKQSIDSLRIPASDEGLAGTGPIRRYDWFQELWLEKRQGWAKQVTPDQGALVFLGDSITQSWTQLAQAFPGVKVANRGISGDTTRGVLLRLKGDVMDLNPSGIVLLIGTNDLEEEAEPSSTAGNLSLILKALKTHNPKMPIILSQVFPASASMKRPADKISEINKLYAEAVKGDPQITMLDTWTLFADDKGDAKKDEFPDLLHPNGRGYDKWAAALRPLMATLGFLENEPDTFTPEPGFVSLFNGQDLTGWGYRPTTEAMKKQAANWKKNDPNAPPWPVVAKTIPFTGMKASPDGRYLAKNGRLVVTTPPEGRKIQQLWTTKEYAQDFVLKLEFRATPNADSGVFLRGKQLQCRDFLLAGPYTELRAYKPQDWNELMVTVTGETALCTVNGEVIENAFKIPASGPLGLEGDRGQVEYRRIRIMQR
ncbi:MAG: lysophospholipase L1-like esterase [Verrucomicrobiales bacterium]|jgi:lysophospholipase L1-like esterase